MTQRKDLYSIPKPLSKLEKLREKRMIAREVAKGNPDFMTEEELMDWYIHCKISELSGRPPI